MLEFSNLVLSYHNFEETPENLMALLSEMANLTPRVVKVAVMPKHEQDVLDLMNFTRGFKAYNPEQSLQLCQWVNLVVCHVLLAT